MDNFGLGLQSGVPTLNQYFGTFNLTIWTAIVFNIFGDWIELATLCGHRMDNLDLDCSQGCPLRGPHRMGGPYLGLFRLRSGKLSSGDFQRHPYNLTPPPPPRQDLLWLTFSYSRFKQAVTGAEVHRFRCGEICDGCIIVQENLALRYVWRQEVRRG